MALSFKLYAIERKRKKNGEVPIYLRITKNKKYRYASTGISLDIKYWNNKTCKVRKNHPMHARLNKQLKDFVESAKDMTSELNADSQTIYTVKGLIKRDDGTNFFNYAESFAQKLADDENLFEGRQTLVLLGHFAGYLKTKNIEFADITLKKINDFRRYLAEVKENNANTINKKMKRLRRIFKQARREGVTTHNPFADYESLPSEKPDKPRLTPEQMKAIAELDLKEKSSLWHTRNIFLFSYYNAGIRFGDLCQLRWRNLVDGYLVYKMSKTDTIKKIKLTKPVLAILELYKPSINSPGAYIFPILRDEGKAGIELKKQISSKNAIANKNLKRIAVMANIQANVTFHVARHSFADYARQSNLSIYDISKALGHSDIKITEQYLASFDDHSLDKSMEDLFG